MAVKEFAEDCECPIKVLSAYNNKVLCCDFNPDKHKEVGDRWVFKYWAELKTERNPGFGNYAVPIICI